jgi:hypothetical protein
MRASVSQTFTSALRPTSKKALLVSEAVYQLRVTLELSILVEKTVSETGNWDVPNGMVNPDNE